MTAASLFVQHDAAHLLVDGALYDSEAIVVALTSKVLVAHSMRLAIAPAGRCTAHDLAAIMEPAPIDNQASVMAALPSIARAIVADNRRAAQPEPHLQLYVALWSDRNDEPQGWMLSSNVLPHWGTYEPYSWLPVTSMIGTVAPLTAVLGRASARPDTIDPIADGRAILDYQRRTPFDDGRFYVGGHGELVTVSRIGVEQRILCRWSDRIGERIVPSRAA